MEANFTLSIKCGVVLEPARMIVSSELKNATLVCNRPAVVEVEGKHLCQLHYGVIETIAARNDELGIVGPDAEETPVAVGEHVMTADEAKSTADGGKIDDRVSETRDSNTRELVFEKSLNITAEKALDEALTSINNFKAFGGSDADKIKEIRHIVAEDVPREITSTARLVVEDLVPTVEAAPAFNTTPTYESTPTYNEPNPFVSTVVTEKTDAEKEAEIEAMLAKNDE